MVVSVIAVPAVEPHERFSDLGLRLFSIQVIAQIVKLLGLETLLVPVVVVVAVLV